MKLTDEQAEDALDRVESTLGMAHGAWDMVDRISIFRAIESEVLRGITGDGRGEAKLWLWKNFVNSRPEYLAFDNPYPTRMDCGDPQTLGEPCGYAIFKWSRNGRPDVSEERVLAAIARAIPSQQQQAAPGAVPDGFVLVPVEADDRIKRAIFVMLSNADDEGLFYRKLIQMAATPKPQEPRA